MDFVCVNSYWRPSLDDSSFWEIKLWPLSSSCRNINIVFRDIDRCFGSIWYNDIFISFRFWKVSIVANIIDENACTRCYISRLGRWCSCLTFWACLFSKFFLGREIGRRSCLRRSSYSGGCCLYLLNWRSEGELPVTPHVTGWRWSRTIEVTQLKHCTSVATAKRLLFEWMPISFSEKSSYEDELCVLMASKQGCFCLLSLVVVRHYITTYRYR